MVTEMEKQRRIKKTPELNGNDVKCMLVKEAVTIPFGFEEEVYYDVETGKISFSSPMTHNTWTRSDDIVGRVESLQISELEGFQTIADSDFIEIDDSCGETDKDFIPSEDFERYYGEDSSIVTEAEAIDRICDVACDSDFWYEEIVKDVEKRYNCYINGEEYIEDSW